MSRNRRPTPSSVGFEDDMTDEYEEDFTSFQRNEVASLSDEDLAFAEGLIRRLHPRLSVVDLGEIRGINTANLARFILHKGTFIFYAIPE